MVMKTTRSRYQRGDVRLRERRQEFEVLLLFRLGLLLIQLVLVAEERRDGLAGAEHGREVLREVGRSSLGVRREVRWSAVSASVPKAFMSRTATDSSVAASPYTASFSASVSMTRGNGIPDRESAYMNATVRGGGRRSPLPERERVGRAAPPPVVHPDRERGAEGRRRQRQQEEEFGEPEP